MFSLVCALLLQATSSANPELKIQIADKPPQDPIQQAIDAASCTGEYADAILALAPRARELERRPEANYSYCLRNTATYECLHYDDDGKLKKRNITAIAHGTAFAYQVKAGEYYLLTNDHVATWPAVTHEDEVSGVPAGCKKIDEQLRLVRDESDDYEPGQIPVSKVATEPSLDAAVVKAKQKLNLMPYRIGRSALLKSGNVVEVRGFPLGLLEATNYGKVVSAYDRDHEKKWDHTDFVTDALLTRGNSGSPVFAISCRSGELELVGLYHAGYRDSPALNVVVAIDELREFMETFKRTRPPPPDDFAFTEGARAALVAGLGKGEASAFFPLADRIARARLDGDSIVYDIFNDRFPALGWVAAAFREVPGTGAGALDSVGLHVGNELRWIHVDAADAEVQDLARRLFALSRRQLMRALAFREADLTVPATREAFKRTAELARQLALKKNEANDLLRALSEAAVRIPPPSAPAAVAAPSPASPPDAKPLSTPSRAGSEAQAPASAGPDSAPTPPGPSAKPVRP